MKYQTISLKQFFPAKGAIYYVAIATVIFSHVKITCYFQVWIYNVFARKLTWYFIGVYIINTFFNIEIKDKFLNYISCVFKGDDPLHLFLHSTVPINMKFTYVFIVSSVLGYKRSLSPSRIKPSIISRTPRNGREGQRYERTVEKNWAVARSSSSATLKKLLR